MSIVFDKMKTRMNLIKEYQKNNNLGFSLSLNDATEEQLKNNTVPIFEVDNKKMGKTVFFDLIKKVEYRNIKKISENEYIVNGKINVGYSGDKWNPEPIYKDYCLKFKCWNYYEGIFQYILKNNLNLQI